jgi:hypothetical protein
MVPPISNQESSSSSYDGEDQENATQPRMTSSSSLSTTKKIFMPKMLSRLENGASWSQSARNIRAELESIRSQPGFREEDMMTMIQVVAPHPLEKEQEKVPAVSKTPGNNEDTTESTFLDEQEENEDPDDDDYDDEAVAIAELQAKILAIEVQLQQARLQAAEKTTLNAEVQEDDDESVEYEEVSVEDDDAYIEEYEEVSVHDEEDDEPVDDVDADDIQSSVVHVVQATATPPKVEEVEEKVYTCEETEERVLVNWESQEKFFRRRLTADRKQQVSLPGQSMSLKDRMRQFQTANN